jgi:hypothetical protein
LFNSMYVLVRELTVIQKEAHLILRCYTPWQY